MKKALIIILLSVLGLSLVNAESAFGMRGGLNISNREFSGDSNLSTGDRTGFHVGLLAQLRTEANIIIQPELLYTQKGYTYDGVLVDHEYNFDYVELPIAIKYDINLKGFHLQPYVAPQAGYAVIAKDIQDNILDALDGEADLSDEIKRINYGVDLGLDIMVLDDLLLGARYQIGLADLDPPIIIPLKDDDIYTHRGWMFSIGYLF
ncbi:MAG: porin family protein [Candidatus Cloacimonetes bacterium]|nr:porin family protein [Candidatus Cloacimonadota bacterium]